MCQFKKCRAEKRPLDDSPAVIDTKEKSNVESEKNSEEGPSIEDRDGG